MIKTEVSVKQMVDTEQKVETLDQLFPGEFFSIDPDSNTLYMLITDDNGGDVVYIDMGFPEQIICRDKKTAKNTIIYRPHKVTITFEM